MKSVKSKIRAPDSFLLGVPLTESCLDFVISIKWYTFGLKYWYTFQLKKTGVRTLPSVGSTNNSLTP